MKMVKRVVEEACEVYGVMRHLSAKCLGEGLTGQEMGLEHSIEFFKNPDGDLVMVYVLEKPDDTMSVIRFGHPGRLLTRVFSLYLSQSYKTIMCFRCDEKRDLDVNEKYESFSIEFVEKAVPEDVFSVCLRFCKDLLSFYSGHLLPYFIFKNDEVKFRYPTVVRDDE